MSATKWSDDKFLNDLRAHCDLEADECVALLHKRGDDSTLFRALRTNCDPLPHGAPEPLVAFFEATRALPVVEADRQRFPDGIDHARLRRGEQVFFEHALVSCIVLLAKAMPEGYAAPCLSKLLNISGNLEQHPFKRLLGVLQMVINVLSNESTEPPGSAIVTAQQVRLMHAGIRGFVCTKWKGYDAYVAAHGRPVNLEDMLGTIMGLSLLVIRGMQQLDVSLSDQEAEDYYYVWRVFAQMTGIHPPGERDNSAWVPASIAEADEFYASYERRHYTDAARNPDGVQLAQENLDMLEFLLPKHLRRLGLQGAASFYMTELIGPEGCARVNLKPFGRYPVTRFLLASALKIWVKGWNLLDRSTAMRSVHYRLSKLLFDGLIHTEYSGQVTYCIPKNLKQVQAMMRTTA